MLARVKLKEIDGGPHKRWSMWCPVTSATLIVSCFKETSKTASDKLEEGEDDVKSACPLNPGLHTCYNG